MPSLESRHGRAGVNWLRSFWQRITTPPELFLLRAENRRLKDTNLALEEENTEIKRDLRGAINTTLAQAGAQPLPGAEEVKPPTNRMRNLSHQQAQRLYALRTTEIRERLIAENQKKAG